ncbi:MAG TPA: universal stress protein [Nitrospiraceae bacterium]|nr:universal stress protein [Nitrospiraceae bacterium]
MAKYRKILIAVDGSESSKNALHQAFKLANEEKCWITVTAVVSPYDGEVETLGIADIRAVLRKPCEDALAEVNKIATTERMLIKTVCEEGEIYEQIVDLADAENCQVIVMGRRGRSKTERTRVGHVTARVIGHTSRDVLVVPAGTVIGWKKIVLATDGSRQSSAAVERAIAFAQSYGGGLRVLSVVDVTGEFHAEAPQVVEELVRKAKTYTAAVKQKAAAVGIQTETFVAEGDAADAVTELARTENADVIVVGSHGRTGLRRLLMGSVTERIIGSASCPVLVVKS